MAFYSLQCCGQSCDINAYLVQRIDDPESVQKVVNMIDLLEFTCPDNVENSSSEESNEQSSTDNSDNEFRIQNSDFVPNGLNSHILYQLYDEVLGQQKEYMYILKFTICPRLY